SPTYSIVGAPEGAKPQELDYPDDTQPNGQANNTYSGKGGVPVGSLFERLLFTAKFQEGNILLSDLVNPESRILWIREPVERIEKVAPWLTLDSDPYPSVVDGRIVWIVDGYTTTNGYPYSRRTSLGEATADSLTSTRAGVIVPVREEVNYIRNSVKATVDAYDGTVTLYEWDQTDPVLKAWRAAFPGTVQDYGTISPDLMQHLRYPEDFFKVQRKLFAEYHVTDPRAFYSGQDFWKVPDDPTAPAPDQAQPPYYLTLQMPGQSAPAFSLTTTFAPFNRDTLAAFMAVNAQPGPDFGTIRVLQLPSNTTIPGPGQVQNNFEADPDVATTLSLLRRGGSEVDLGNLLSLPVGGGVLYVEPVYVRASTGQSSYPLLKKVLVSFGNRIGFADTLPQALDQVFEGDAGTSPPPDTDGEQPPVDDTLEQALADAEQALTDADAALKAGDFAAYGEAQQRLADAIARAVAASGGTPATPTSPSPEPTVSAAPAVLG
nr:UPF0182 family protein [Actinomycetes bacterium]